MDGSFPINLVFWRSLKLFLKLLFILRFATFLLLCRLLLNLVTPSHWCLLKSHLNIFLCNFLISDEFILCLHIGLFRFMKALFIDQRRAWSTSGLRLHVFVGWVVDENALAQSTVSELQITTLQPIKKLLNILDILLVFVIELDGLLAVLILDEIIMLTAEQILDGMLFVC